jgi:hypothetical protein
VAERCSIKHRHDLASTWCYTHRIGWGWSEIPELCPIGARDQRIAELEAGISSRIAAVRAAAEWVKEARDSADSGLARLLGAAEPEAGRG